MLLTAAISDAVFNFTTDVVDAGGLIGIFVLMLLDAACIPVPSEITMLFGGFSVSQGHHNLVAVTAAGLAGNLVGSLLAFAVGRYGRQWLDRRGAARRIISPRHLESADRWFNRYGDASVLVARIIPVARTFISLPAGASRMTWTRFTVLTVVGCLPWVFIFALLGKLLGQHWDSLRGGLQYADYAVVAIAVLGVAYVLVQRSRRATSR